MQMNPFEIKAEILNIISDCAEETDIRQLEYRVSELDKQADKFSIEKILFRELLHVKTPQEKVLRFLLQRYVPKDRLIEQLWNVLRNNMTSSEVKIIVLSYLRELETDWKYEDFEGALGQDVDILDEDTKRLLGEAIINPEVQIDFLDFLSSVKQEDKALLLQSLAEDYSKDELANILIPVFLAEPKSELGQKALELLAQTRSQLAYHAINSALKNADEDLKPLLKKNLSVLKLSGVREDNSIEFYKQLLSSSRPYRCCATYVDGQGNQALIFSRTNKEKRVQFVAIVVNDYNGIRDCFGFNDISEFECDKIIERFCRDDKHLPLPPSVLKTLLKYGERITATKTDSKKLPYEYVCWKNIMTDIEPEEPNFDEILSKYYEVREVSRDDLSDILGADFTERWFLDPNYSSEYEAFLEILDVEILDTNFDIDGMIDEYLTKVFYTDEYNVWKERLLVTSYMKHADRDDEVANILYSIYHQKAVYDEFLKMILRKSVYEYYFSLKYNTEYNQNKFTTRQLDDIILSIENKWVNNV